MKSKLLSFFLLLFCCCAGRQTYAQYENVWAFGQNAGFDFTSLTPKPIKTGIITSETCASICDEDGNLLFYTNGQAIWNRAHTIMPAGDSLTPFSLYGSTCQGAIIVPDPGSVNRYYVFSLTENEMIFQTGPEDVGKLYYSIVDMTLDNGLGNVDVQYKSIYLDSMLTEQMRSVPGNDCNVWLLTLSRTDHLKAYSIDSSGISAPVLSDVSGTNPDLITVFSDNFISGSIDVSPDRSLIAIARQNNTIGNMKGKLGLYDFNPGTGMAYNERILNATESFYAACFSPDNTKLYCCTPEKFFGSGDNGVGEVFQLDLSSLTEQDIINSRTSLYQMTGENIYRRPYGMKRGPDGKIYICLSGFNGNRYNMDVILQPNLAGQACQYTMNALVDTFHPDWYPRIGLPNVISIAQYGGDTYMSSSDVNVCFRDKVTLLVNKDNSKSYLWSTGVTDSNLVVEESGTYWVQYKVSCNTFIDTFHVHIFNPRIETDPSCFNEEVGSAYLVFDEAGAYSYSTYWMNDRSDTLSASDSMMNVASGNYSLRVVTDNGCDTLIAFSVGVLDYRVSFSPSDSIICSGDTVHFLNESDNYYTSFQWQLATGSASTAIHPLHVYDQPGNYSIMLTGEGARCRDTAYGTIVADAVWDLLRFKADKEDICIGEKIEFETQKSDSTLLSFHWQPDDDNAYTTSDVTITHAYDHSGIFAVILTGRFRACPDISFADTIRVHSFPLVSLGTDSVLCLEGSTLTLQNQYAAEEGYSYLWNTGATSRELAVVHEGKYTLKVTNTQGCATEETIRVAKDCYGNIPNAFTPNGDGVNDYFYPGQYLTSGVIHYRMEILNRWGQLIFVTTEREGRGWDGKLNGLDQPGGVYVYRIKVDLKNGRQEKYEGNVTLLR